MAKPRHCARGEATGRETQPCGRHREDILIEPLGDRNRCKTAVGVEYVEDRDSDPNIRRI